MKNITNLELGGQTFPNRQWYCPICKREVMRKLTLGQIIGLFILYSLVVPGIIYSFKHTRKCPNCYSRMYKIPRNFK